MLNNFTPAEQEIEFSNNWTEEDLEDLLTFASSQLDNEHGEPIPESDF